MVEAKCHCGAVNLEIRRRPTVVTECNCSICRRYAARWAYYSPGSVQVTRGRDQLRAYRWGDETIDFFHCRRCGCVTHYESVDGQSTPRVAVNSRLLPAKLMRGVRVRRFDGADTWRYLDD